MDGEVKNISLGGALIRCQELPKEDESFNLLIEIPEYAFPVSATVEKVRLHTPPSDTASPSYDLAIRFLDISEDDFRILCHAVECQARTRDHRPVGKGTPTSTAKKGLLKSMEKLSAELKRPFKELLEEAMQDLVEKYEKKTTDE